ncbi:Protein CBG01096 [Caenorhabditis briggsae]|uniref:Protein CBG01096 n=1 Tax=Caenorhabditis briggsae TaxID=6238 RepID=A8WPJ7_CAEBR|nr:Protein CBG01096 [Caenorhabditis briggsae]CAP22404.2 Protein CBG01096 [Caenorhabditis briggsae]
MSLITSASTLLQIYTWFFEIPALILNILLIFCIHREKRTDNRFRKFNCIFLYFVYSTTCLTVLFPLLHPTLIPARDLIYIVFIGPMADIFSIPMLKFLYCLLTFCYPLLMLKLPYFLFFIVCIIAHRFYMKSIRHISNDCIDLGYNYTCNINRAFLSISFQIFIFIALPFLILDFTIFIRWELGVRALPVTFGCICTCLTTSITLFVHFRKNSISKNSQCPDVQLFFSKNVSIPFSRRQVGYLFIALLRQNNGNFPIFISNQNHQSTHFQLSVMA